jgi:hypothetical protein
MTSSKPKAYRSGSARRISCSANRSCERSTGAWRSRGWGLVLITPTLLKRVDNRGVSDKELSELLARDLLIPVVHETTYEEIRKVSPLLGSRNGFETAEDSMEVIATKIAELVALSDELRLRP